MSKEFVVELTVRIRVVAPDDSPLEAEDVRRMVAWKGNDYRDGRHTFSTELVLTGARHLVEWGVEEAFFHRYAGYPMFRGPEGNARLEKRNAIVARRAAEVFCRVDQGDEGPLDVRAAPSSSGSSGSSGSDDM